MANNTYSRTAAPTPPPAAPALITKPLIDSERISHDNPEQGVDHAQGATAGIALKGDVLGIESEPATTLVKQKLADEAFMQEIVEIMFSEPMSEHEPQFFEAGVNGEKICVRRDGEPVRIKRCFVAIAAQSKAQRLKQVKITNPDGSMGYAESAVLQQVYPFQVIADPSGGRGVTWLRQLLQRS